VKGPAGLLRALGPAEALRLAHLLIQPAGELAQRLFDGEAARLLLLGNAMHADVPVDAPGSGVMGYLLLMMAQDGGWPVPVGGAGQLTAALVARAQSAGARIECGRAVDHIEVTGGRAVAVGTSDGSVVRVRRAVIADTSAPLLYGKLLPPHVVPSALQRELQHFVWDTPVLKIDYALKSAIPWRSKNLGGVGTVHLGADHDGLVRWMADLNTKTVPLHPFMLFGQMTTADPTRSPAGTESAWAYTHLPRGIDDDASADQLAVAVDLALENYAPGFRDAVVGKIVQRPLDLQASDANLHTGAVNGGTSQLFQQLIFRPAPGLGRAETPVENVFLGSAGAPPGGGVHGVCGRNAAHAALASNGLRGWPRRRLNRTVLSLLTR
jgi:phytoene dehydrogenase-like protein